LVLTGFFYGSFKLFRDGIQIGGSRPQAHGLNTSSPKRGMNSALLYHRVDVNFPSVSIVISLAPAGTGVVVIRPPGQRTQIPSGFDGNVMTAVRLSCDQ
jgi:hypothetical protein